MPTGATSTRVIAFPPLYTASTWSTLVGQAAKDAHDRNGDLDALGRKIPRVTNRDALALVIAWRNVAAPLRAWPLWYTYAAAALGWEQDGDALQLDAQRGAQMFGDEFTPSLWLAIHQVAVTLDNAKRDTPAIAPLDVWGDDQVAADVSAALVDDGASASFKQPLPICRDTKTGELRFPRPRKQPDGSIKDPDCEVVTIDDPITAALKALAKAIARAAKPLAVVGGVYLGITLLDRRRRATRRGKRKRHGNARRARSLAP